MEILIQKTTLFKQDAKGNIQVWNIEVHEDEILTTWGQEYGALQEHSEFVDEGKAGRSLDEQILSRINSRINQKLDAGYVKDHAHAVAFKPRNALDLQKPMLAARYDHVKNLDFSNTFMQMKYDGHRCLIYRKSEDEYIAYSRNGKPITTIKHIMAKLEHCSIPIGSTLDGELYIHGVPLQTIASYVKRKQMYTNNLVYMVYDLIYPDDGRMLTGFFAERLAMLRNFIPFVQCSPELQVVWTEKITCDEAVPIALESAILNGYEGLILRPDGFKYEDGKRSKGLVKVKRFIDGEFLVIGVIASKDGWGIIECLADNGKKFTASAPGTVGDKRDVLRYKSDYIGRHVQLKYANLTKDGKPFHPVATQWREKGEE